MIVVFQRLILFRGIRLGKVYSPSVLVSHQLFFEQGNLTSWRYIVCTHGNNYYVREWDRCVCGGGGGGGGEGGGERVGALNDLFIFLRRIASAHNIRLALSERIKQTVNIEATTVDIEEKGVKLRLTVVDTPGFGDAVDNNQRSEVFGGPYGI